MTTPTSASGSAASGADVDPDTTVTAPQPEPCPKGHTVYEECFAPFRYCPEKGCGRAEGGIQLPTEAAPDVPEPTRDDLIRSLLDMAAKRVENAQEKTNLFEPETWPTPHRHYNDVRDNGCGHEVHVGWLEIAQEVEYVQQLMDFVGIPDALSQGRGDADWRVAEAVLRLTGALARLDRIAENHRQEQGDGGMVGSYCVECQWVWPCPTYRFANGDADPLDPWRDDE